MWIAFEGPDRVGKKTQATMLASTLESLGVSVDSVEVPYNGFGGQWSYRTIYAMLNDGRAKHFPITFQLVHLINKLACQAKLMLSCASIAVLDRWHLSSVIYGIASGINARIVSAMGWPLVQPDVTIVLLRASQLEHSDARDSYEEDADLQDRVKHLYASACDGRAIIAVNADGTQDEVAARIKSALNPHLKRANHYVFNEEE